MEEIYQSNEAAENLETDEKFLNTGRGQGEENRKYRPSIVEVVQIATAQDKLDKQLSRSKNGVVIYRKARG